MREAKQIQPLNNTDKKVWLLLFSVWNSKLSFKKQRERKEGRQTAGEKGGKRESKREIGGDRKR